MSYNILAINPGHNGSAALISDGDVKYYLEEERLSRMKYDGNPFRSMIDIMNRFKVDELVIVGTGVDFPQLPWTQENPYTSLVRKFYPDIKTTFFGHEHHMTHAATAFYNSGFGKAVAVVVDGAGTYMDVQMDQSEESKAKGFECESVWKCKYPADFKFIYKTFGDNNQPRMTNGTFDVGNSVTITKAYEAVTNYLGFGWLDAGKTMGLSSYGEEDDNIPTLFRDNRASRDVFIPSYPMGAFVDTNINPIFQRKNDPKEWHRDPSALTDIEKNLAYKIQKDTQELVGDLVEQAAKASGLDNVVIAGGYGLNCVNNYYLKKRFPNLNIYVEPISHDGGTVIGAAKIIYHDKKNDFTKRPQTSIYYGPEYSKDFIKSRLLQYEDKFSTYEGNAKVVAELLSENNIVAVYQGRSEAGPRALGNRSILYNPADPNGKDFVNQVKGREWFRPFAGTVLKEHADEWFDMAGMDSSPFMMYAVDVLPDKVDKIKAITHVDDTCRIQTVTKEQNEEYYNIISEFYKLTDVPIVFNTSFNLAGDPLVETVDDAISAVIRSKMKYIYFPEIELLIEKK